MKFLTDFLLHTPVLTIFLCLCLGNLLGQARIHKFSLGTTVGVLVIGLLIGQLGGFKIDPVVKSIFFDLFIFTIGYEVGPSFFHSLKSNGLKLVLQSIFFSSFALALAVALFEFFKINPGEGAGIISGALTQSATVGTSTSAINGLSISEGLKHTYTSELAIAYALTYVFGALGVLIFLKNIAPMILGIDLKVETKKLVEKLQLNSRHDKTFLTSNINLRVYAISADSPLIGQTLGAIEQRYPDTFIIEEIYRQKEALPASENLQLAADDYLVILGEVAELLHFERDNIGVKEISAETYRQIPLKNVTVMLTKDLDYPALSSLLQSGVMVSSVQRNGKELKEYQTLKAEDRLTLLGMPHKISSIIPELGYEVVDGPKTDLSFLSIGIVLGIILGNLVIHLGGVPLSVGAGGGALFAGLFLGWYQQRHANIGMIPGPTRWFLKNIGLNVFIAIVGLEAGAEFLPALQKMGWQVLAIGALISILPHIATLFFGHYVLKLNPIENIGSLAGSGTHNPAMSAISEETGSSVIALSYTPAFAVANILLTIMGPIVVAILS